MRLICAVCVCIICFTSAASAESKPWDSAKSCEAYSSAGDFVKESNLYCLGKQNSRKCLQSARDYFKKCGFKGDYRKLAKEMHRRILVVLLFAKSSDVARML